MRTRLAALLTALTTVAAVAGIASSPAGAQTAVTDQTFAGYGSGATISANVLQLGQTQTINIQAASAGQSTNSKGLPSGGLFNEKGYIIQPAGLGGQNSYGRGTGLEVGVGTPVPDPNTNQILLSGLAEQAAPPNAAAPVVKQIGPISLGGLAYADILRGQARAVFDPNTCAIGVPYSFGEGDASGLQLIGTANGTNPLTNATVGTTQPAGTDPNNVSRTRSVTYLRPNGDGTYAVVSETREHIAPVSLLNGAITIELLGEWALRAIATGKPGGASVEYAPVGAGPSTNVIAITTAGTTTNITLQQLLGPNGLQLNLGGLLTAAIGAPPRALGGDLGTHPTLAADGTSASGAVDVVRLGVLNVPGLSTLDIRLGHFEAAAVAPAGGVKCNIPVAKSADPNPVSAGGDFTITISIPDPNLYTPTLFGCDLIAIKAVDVHTVASGNATFTLTGADNGGQISSDGTTVTWDNVGNYHLGDPPIQLHVTGHIPSNSPPGTLQDTATVTASLGNCNGTGSGQDIVGQGVSGGVVTGSLTFNGPDVIRTGVLAATGGDERLLILGGVFLLGALGVRRRLRKPVAPTA